LKRDTESKSNFELYIVMMYDCFVREKCSSYS